MRTGRKAEVHKAGGSNGPQSGRPLPAELLRREAADSGDNGHGDPSRPKNEKPDFDAVMSRAEERMTYRPKLGDVLGPQLRRTS